MKFESPAYHIIAVPIEKIQPNTYNPNAVAPPEMKLLYDSIKEDGYRWVYYANCLLLFEQSRSIYYCRWISSLSHYVRLSRYL